VNACEPHPPPAKTFPFPDPRSYRISLADLKRPEVRELLRLVWTDPEALEPAKRSAKVTREVADKLARIANGSRNGTPT
jgi:hypothetical protein